MAMPRLGGQPHENEEAILVHHVGYATSHVLAGRGARGSLPGQQSPTSMLASEGTCTGGDAVAVHLHWCWGIRASRSALHSRFVLGYGFIVLSQVQGSWPRQAVRTVCRIWVRSVGRPARD